MSLAAVTPCSLSVVSTSSLLLKMGTFLASQLSGRLPLDRLLNQLSTAALFLPVTSQKWSLVLRVCRRLAAADADEELDDGGSPRVFWIGFLFICLCGL